MLASRSEETRRHGTLAPNIGAHDVPGLLAEFRTSQSRACVVLELICLGHVDGHFCAAEGAFVKQVAGAFGISRERLQQMETWTADQLERSREAARFWSA